MLEYALNSALHEMALSSIKIAGKGNQTVFILRLSTTNLPHHVSQNFSDQSAVYRRKNPSQINRDRRRAEIHRQRNTEHKNKASQTSEPSPSGLFLPTPPSLFYSDKHENDINCADIFSFSNNASPCVGLYPTKTESQCEKDTIQCANETQQDISSMLYLYITGTNKRQSLHGPCRIGRIGLCFLHFS